MMRIVFWGRLAQVLAAALLLVIIGCGESDSNTARTENLTEQQQQQIRELDAQRQEEWSRKKK